MPSLRTIYDCMFSPKLLKIYGNGPAEKYYQPSSLEKWSGKVINSIYVIWRLGIYTSPALAALLYQRGYFDLDGLLVLSQLAAGVGVVLVASMCARAMSRADDPAYRQFVDALRAARRASEMSGETKRRLRAYEFGFASWPVEYKCRDTIRQNRQLTSSKPLHLNLMQSLLQIPYKAIAYVAIHTFGIRLIYPGSIGLLQMVLEQSLLQGRSRLIEVFRGERFKIETADENEIDAMFVNNRGVSTNGNTLVICCEGNAGFYEIGIAMTPLAATYSVLGWNHPGFAGSTGRPYPPQEQNAMNAVIQFAVHKLHFKLENILLFGWSIGGYSTSWGAMNYPEIKGVILDATFDDVLPLAVNHMPSWWGPIINIAIREHVNLNIFEQLSKYPGPVLLFRRTEDEVICLSEGDLSSNRGNHLLYKLLRHRYPFIFDAQQSQLLLDYLAVPQGYQEFFAKYSVDERVCQSLLQSYISEYSKSYPMKIGEDFSSQDKSKMALYLAKNYMKDFKSTHCVNLPPEMFQPPWDVTIESDFVFT
ncbi:unnamed protein product [Phaedon cochleariae]|uniref:Uncharacterized protein n=1 Tax=Phaedon cochleariae TaxID=80249 RepID=A0A9P0DML6_PHACE|nr:unnamed protein product [Phaedon cochleariae]